MMNASSHVQIKTKVTSKERESVLLVLATCRSGMLATTNSVGWPQMAAVNYGPVVKKIRDWGLYTAGYTNKIYTPPAGQRYGDLVSS